MTKPAPTPNAARRWAALGLVLILGLCYAHGWAIWMGIGQREGVSNPWPIALDDHPVHFHCSTISPRLFRLTGTTTGYDPSFMAGYPKSVYFPQSSALFDLFGILMSGREPGIAYKVGVLIAGASLPWIFVLAASWAGLRPLPTAIGLVLFLLYLWSDFPINYAGFGMTPYLVAVPIGLATTVILARYLERGGFGRWLASAIATALVFLAHLTSAFLVGPAALLAYLTAWVGGHRRGQPLSRSRHLGFWALAITTLAANVFWWGPGLWLSDSQGESGFVLANREPVLGRLAKIVTIEPRIEWIIWLIGGAGLVALIRRNRLLGVAVGGYVLAGFGWGYVAGAFRTLDFLQPGRHTYAFYSGLCLAGGLGFSEVVGTLWRRSRGLAIVAAFAAAGVVAWQVEPQLRKSLVNRLDQRAPFLTGKPTTQMLWIMAKIRRHMEPGERLLYEESGFNIPGLQDPYYRRRYSGLIPYFTGVEVIGGPYLHAAVSTNFTQFGEGKLFGKANWTEDDFRRYARIYRPSAILCWTPTARSFCLAHPELIEVKEDDGALLLGRIKGYEGSTIRGRAEVSAEPGRIRVKRAESDELDGLIVLRYHFVPCLRSSPPVPIVPVRLEDDPVPFIGLRPTKSEVTIEMRFPP